MWELPCQEFRLWNRFFYMPKIRVRYFSVRALFLSITKMEDINEIDIYMRQKLEAFLFFVIAVGVLERRDIEGKRVQNKRRS